MCPFNSNHGAVQHYTRKTSVKFCVCINSELSASIFVHRQEIRRNHPCWDGMPLSFPSAKSVELLMRRLSTFSVCFGNPDEDLQTLASVDTEITTANSTDIVAFREGDFCASKGNVSYHPCIRAKDCAMLVIGSRCKPCQDVRRTLQKRRLRDNKRKDRPSKNFVHTGTLHNMMTWENLLTKLDQQRVEMKSLNRELSKLRQKCEQEIDTKGVQLQDSESSEMKDFMAVCREDVERSFPDENCFQRLF